MKTTGKTIAVFAALLLLLTISTTKCISQEEPAASAPQAAATATQAITGAVPDFDFKDVYGRIVKAQDLKDWIVVYGFGNEDNADVAIGWLKNITFANPNATGVLYVSVADASKYDKIMYPFVKKVVKQEYKKKITQIRNEFTERGIPCNFVLEDRYMITIDTKANIFKLFGIGDLRKQPHLFIVDGARNVRGHFTEYSDAVPALFAKVIAERDVKKNFIMTTHAKKKNSLRRYALGAAAVWLISLAF